MAIRDDGDSAEVLQLPDQPQSAPLPDPVLSFHDGLQHQAPADENGNPTVEILNISVDTCQQSAENSDQATAEPHAGCVELRRSQAEDESNDKDDDWVIVGLDLGDSSQQITIPLAESSGTSGVEGPVCESVSNLFPEDGQGTQMDPAIGCDSSSSLLHFCSSEKRKSVQFASSSLHDSVKTTASTRTPTPFASPSSSFTSLDEDMGESSELYEALPDDPALPSTSRGTEPPSADLHQGANNDDGDTGDGNDNDDGGKDAATIHELDTGASASAAAASAQKRFPFMERFSRKAPLVLLPQGCPKLTLPQRPAVVGRCIDVMCSVLRDLFGSNSCSCSGSDQVVAVTVVPSSPVVTRPEKARQSPELMQLAM